MSEIETVTLTEFCRIVGTSEPTARKVIDACPDFPIVDRGAQGRGYQIPVPAGPEWWRARDAAIEAERKARAEQVDQMAMGFLGDGSALGAAPVAGLTAAEKEAAIAAELAAIKLGQARGDLIRKADVEQGLAEFCVLWSKRYADLASRLSKRVEMRREAIAALEGLCRQDMHALADAMVRMGAPESVRDDPGADDIAHSGGDGGDRPVRKRKGAARKARSARKAA